MFPVWLGECKERSYYEDLHQSILLTPYFLQFDSHLFWLLIGWVAICWEVFHKLYYKNVRTLTNLDYL